MINPHRNEAKTSVNCYMWYIYVIPFTYTVHYIFFPSLFILTASEICRNIASFLNCPVTDMRNTGTCLSCSSLLCFQRAELSSLLDKDVKCSLPLVYALRDVSPMYTLSLSLSLTRLVQVILYITP